MLGDILGHAGDARNLPCGIGDWKAAIPDPANRSIWAYDAIFFVGTLAAPLMLEARVDALKVSLMNGFQERVWRSIETCTAALPDLFIGRADVEQLGLMRVDQP